VRIVHTKDSHETPSEALCVSFCSQCAAQLETLSEEDESDFEEDYVWAAGAQTERSALTPEEGY
jgi:hypothetical protein